MTKVSYQGEKGSFSYIAVKHLFADAKYFGFQTFDEACKALSVGEADYSVLPIENSTHGSVYQNYDNIYNYNFKIIGEIYVKINFHLIVHPGVKIEDLDVVYSHPVALNQIKKFRQANPHIDFIEYSDTAGSVAMIKNKGMKNAGAAASRMAADIYNMEILKENIHENSKNYTRFFVLSRKDYSFNSIKSESLNFKTTIQFTLGEEAGSLYKSLRCFADRDISLSKIESRPIIDTDWEYRFYIDVESGLHEERTQLSLKELRNYVRELRVLGTYSKGVYINS
jgi:prephenate dehydratase